MFCQECGTKNPDSAKFCFSCGAQLADLNEEIKGNEIENSENFTTIQQRYIDKIGKEVFRRYYQGMTINKEDYYENAKLYNLSEKDVDFFIDKWLTIVKKFYDYVNIEVLQLGNYKLPNDAMDSIHEYGDDLGLSEFDIEKIIEKYETDHNLNEKQAMYESLFYTYFEGYIQNDDDDDNDNTFLEKLTSEEQKEVTERFGDNIGQINQLIDEEYSKTSKIDLEQKQLWRIIELAHKLGFVDSADIMAIMLKYQDEHGITTEKNKQAAAQFRSMVDQAYSKEIQLFGQSRKLEGHLIFKNLIGGIFRNQAELLKKQWEKINSKSDSAVADMAYAIAQYGSSIGEALHSIDNTLPPLEVDVYFEDIQTYIIQKLADICAVNTALQNIDTNTDVQALYRQARKAYRSQWMGGGFGLAGALKGAATAGVLNLGSGAIHSAVNAVGNAKTKYTANKQKRALIEEIKKGVPEEIKKLTEGLINNVFDYLDELYPDAFLSEDNGQEDEVYKKFLNASDESKKILAVTLLQQNPYVIEYYEQILLAYPNEKTYRSLIEIGDDLGVENLSDILRQLAVREYKIYKEHTDINAIEFMHTWFEIMHMGIVTDKGTNEVFRYELAGQLENFTGNDLEEFVSNLLEYQKKTSDKELLVICNNRVSGIVSQNKKKCAKIEASNVNEIEELVDNLIALKPVAKEEEKEVINNITKRLVEFKKKSIESKIDITNIDDICRRKYDIKVLHDKYGYSEWEEFVAVLHGVIDKNISNCSTQKSLKELQNQVLQLKKKTSIDLSKAEKKIEDLIKKKDVEERTVLGIVYDTVEEANEERKKVVGNKKFESIEEANRERYRLQCEKELENQEMDIIKDLESKGLSDIDILKEILARNFKSEQAMNKRREYNDKVLRMHISLEAKKNSGESAKLYFKRFILTIVGIIAIVVAIRPFLGFGWIGKIIIFCLVCLPWGWRMDITEKIKSLKTDMDTLKYVESLFTIKDGLVYLKNIPNSVEEERKMC